MNLCVDIGNTSEKISIYDGQSQIYFERSETIEAGKLKELQRHHPYTHVIVSSTKALTESLRLRLDLPIPFLELDHTTPVPIHNLYHSPETLGRDRIAAAVAANSLYGGQHKIVIDAGTCITADFIDNGGSFLGGNISPGIRMRLKAMNHFTSKLPLVDMIFHEEIIGKTTAQAMQNGAVRGAIWEIMSFIKGILRKYGTSNIILTGGDAKIFEDHINFRIFAHPDLIHIGLNKILDYNK